MMNPSLKSQCKAAQGTIIEGKWHNKKYLILRELGYGANGIVYLAKSGNHQVALKLSDNGMSITSEVNVLKSFAKVQGSALGPSLIDVDDWDRRGNIVSFYAMEYIEGPGLLEFIKQKGPVWINVLFLQLLNDLHRLHEAGWIFGDLKPENLIITGPSPRIRCIDVGGTTIMGRAIKEYTEFYDRGYWGLGTRKAEPTYDLFALAMVMITIAYPDRFNKTSGGISQLTAAIGQKKELIPYGKLLHKALQGHYTTALQMREDFIRLINNSSTSSTRYVNTHKSSSQTASGPQKNNAPNNSIPNSLHKAGSPKPGTISRQTLVQQKQAKQTSRGVIGKQKKKGGFRETLFILTAVAVFYIIYIAGQLL